MNKSNILILDPFDPRDQDAETFTQSQQWEEFRNGEGGTWIQ